MIPEQLVLLEYWVKERESIRKKRQKGQPSPWTDDPVLQKYRFCNVRRESDAVTIWIKEHIREPFADNPNLWFMCCIARQLNHPATLAELIAARPKKYWPWDNKFSPAAMGQLLQDRKDRGEQVYTGAYMIRAESSSTVAWFNWTKQQYMAEIVLGTLWWHRSAFSNVSMSSLQSVHSRLTEFRGWGPFMAYQAVVDMRFCPKVLGNAPDIETWAAAGPGTIQGLNRLCGRPVKAGLSQEDALKEIRALYPIAASWAAMDFSDVPNILCEYAKWVRVNLGEGRSRSLYKPRVV